MVAPKFAVTLQCKLPGVALAPAKHPTVVLPGAATEGIDDDRIGKI